MKDFILHLFEPGEKVWAVNNRGFFSCAESTYSVNPTFIEEILIGITNSILVKYLLKNGLVLGEEYVFNSEEEAEAKCQHLNIQ